MLNKKLLLGVGVLSLVALSPLYSMAAQPIKQDSSSFNMYVGASGAGQMIFNKKFVTTGVTGADGKEYEPDYKIGYELSAQVGLPIASLRVEAEFNYANITPADKKGENDNTIFKISNNTYKNTGFSHMAGLLNVYYDLVGVIGSSNAVVPYIGGGVGFAHITFGKIARNTLAYQGKAGASMEISKDLRAYLGYKYFAVLDGENGFEKVQDTGGVNPVNIKAHYSSHAVEAGVMMNFKL